LASNIAQSAAEMSGDAKLSLAATGVVLFAFAVNLLFSHLRENGGTGIG